MIIDHEVVLSMWAEGIATSKIAAAVGTMYENTIGSIVAKHRVLGDPRAINRAKAVAFKSGATNNIKRYHRTQKFRRHPILLADIPSMIASYTGEITHCPPGWHAGHRPTALAEIGL